MKLLLTLSSLILASASLVACSTTSQAPTADVTPALNAMLKASFRDQGIAKTDRLAQDQSNQACSDPTGQTTPEQTKVIEAANLKTIQWPADNNYLGDWKLGETIAQSGRGATWSDSATATNGGNCYNCHQISKQEISHGTIGPSLYQYGKLRGVTNPSSDQAKAVVQYTWGKIYNAKAYNACSGMPRLGHSGVLTAEQIKHVMALLLDPASPVNQ
jgi:L-cysteine S-thiosulfotransferase